MAHIGISILSSSIGGPRTYAVNLARELLKTDSGNQYFIFCDRASMLPKLEGAVVVEIRMAGRYGRLAWDQFELPFFLKRHSIDLYHSTKNVIPFVRAAKNVVTIHDLAPLIFPETFTFLQRLYLRFHLPQAVKLASIVVTDSENSRADLRERLGVPAGKIRVVPLGVSKEFHPIDEPAMLAAVREKYDLPSRAIMYVGTLQPRKNLDILICSFARLKSRERIPHKLVLVGRKGWMYEKLFDQIRALGLTGEVVFTGAVPDAELPLLLNCAEVFVSPSSYEGFGLTVLEAMACGVPVVTSNVSSLPEVAGEAAVLVEPRDVDALTEALGSVTGDRNLRSDLRSRGLARAGRFTWENSARQVLSIYQELLN